MDKVLDLVRNSIPWLFSGAGVTLLGFFIHKKNSKKPRFNIRQKQENYDKSMGIQIGQQNKYYTENSEIEKECEDNG